MACHAIQVRWLSGTATAALLASLAFYTTAAHAQNAATEPAAAEATSAGSEKDIIVTGSRIARRDYQSDSPIVTVGQESIKSRGPSTMEAVLNTLPAIRPSRVGGTNVPYDGGRNIANLRGMGAGRTLTLLDGRRLQPSDIAGNIDLNSIPEQLVGNVEVITGGASALYGSDAVAGVVNFKLRTDLEGLQLDGEYAITQRGDSGTYNLAATFGHSFAEGRGRVDLSMSYLQRDQSLRSDRDFFLYPNADASRPCIACTRSVVNPVGSLSQFATISPIANNLPSQTAINAIFARYGVAGINVPRNAVLSMNADGTLFTSTATAAIPILNLRYGTPLYLNRQGQVAQQNEGQQLQVPNKKYNFFARATYELTDSVSVYSQFMFTHYTNLHRAPFNGYLEPTIPVTNPFVSADLRELAASRPNPTAPLTYSWTSSKMSLGLRTRDTSTVYQGLLGLKGDLPISDWKWDIYGSLGRSTDQVDRFPNTLRAKITQLVNAPDGGRSVCPGGFNPFSLVPLDADPATKACFDFVTRESTAQYDHSQFAAEGTLQGTLFKLPAGEVKFAAGLGYRRSQMRVIPPAIWEEGLVIDLGIGDIYHRQGSDTVKEAFAELLIPVIRDAPLIKEFTIDLAGRISDYRSVGTVNTYKASADWKVVDAIRLRGGYQRAIRAPNLNELYGIVGPGGALVGARPNGDPCDVESAFRKGADGAKLRALCLATGVPNSVVDIFQSAASAFVTTSTPVANVHEETANTITAGVVLRSPFGHPLLSRLQFSVDYYDIKLKDAIGQITAAQAVNLCYNTNGGSNPTYDPANLFCKLVARGAADGQFSVITTPRLNLASLRRRGIDFQLDYSAPLSAFGLNEKWGTLGLNAILTRNLEVSSRPVPGAQIIDIKGSFAGTALTAVPEPSYKLQASLSWNVRNLTTTLTGRHIPSMFDAQDIGRAHTLPGLPAVTYFDASFAWKVNSGLSFRGGILNLTDKDPPFVPPTYGFVETELYDILGRRFYISVSKKF